MYSPNATAGPGDYDISERDMGTWTKDEYGIPYFVPTAYQVGERAIFEEAEHTEFLRAFGIGTWLTAMPRRFAGTRVEYPGIN